MFSHLHAVNAIDSLYRDKRASYFCAPFQVKLLTVAQERSSLSAWEALSTSDFAYIVINK